MTRHSAGSGAPPRMTIQRAAAASQKAKGKQMRALALAPEEDVGCPESWSESPGYTHVTGHWRMCITLGLRRRALRRRQHARAQLADVADSGRNARAVS